MSILGLSGLACAGEAYDALYRIYDLPKTLSRDAVPVCMHHDCGTVRSYPISAAEWQRVVHHFQPVASSAAREREQIRKAVAEMEQIAGERVGTANEKGGDIAAFGSLDPQMDCIDESTNTTTYLTLFDQAQLLRWHSVEKRAHRGYLFFGGWPHFTAVIREHDGGEMWVVDSWFRDNGVPPDVLTLEAWKSGWKPEGFRF